MTRAQSFLMGAAGALALLVVVVGVAYAADIFTVDKDGTVRLQVTDTSVNVPYGRVGIGTTNPTTLFEIVAVEGFPAPTATTYGTTQASQIVLRRARGTETAPEAIQVNDTLGAVSFRGHTGSAFTASKAYVAAVATENWSETGNGTRLGFNTTPNGSTTAAERMRIDQNGNIRIGNVGIPASSALLDMSSTTGALLIPRLTTAERDALTAANGMIVYNTSTNAFNFRENGAWVTK